MSNRYYPKISEAKLLKDLRRVSRKLKKKIVSATQYNLHGAYTDSTYMDRFGSWNKAIIAAGLTLCDYGRIPKVLLLKNLEKVRQRLKRLPQKRDMCSPLSKYSATAYRNNFGSWSSAIKHLHRYMKDKKVYLEQLKLSEEKQVLKNIEKVLQKKKKENRSISYRLRYMILDRDRYMCRACGASPSDDARVKLEIDHIIPWSKGGDSSPGNLQTLCSICNNGKGNLLQSHIKKASYFIGKLN